MEVPAAARHRFCSGAANIQSNLNFNQFNLRVCLLQEHNKHTNTNANIQSAPPKINSHPFRILRSARGSHFDTICSRAFSLMSRSLAWIKARACVCVWSHDPSILPHIVIRDPACIHNHFLLRGGLNTPGRTSHLTRLDTDFRHCCFTPSGPTMANYHSFTS